MRASLPVSKPIRGAIVAMPYPQTYPADIIKVGRIRFFSIGRTRISAVSGMFTPSSKMIPVPIPDEKKLLKLYKCV